MSNNNEKETKKSNVVMFPHVDKLLTEKALTSLENKQFLEAVYLFEEAKKLDQENEQILVGLLIAYVEAGMFIDAKESAQQLLQKGIGDYDQIVDIYLMVLIQLEAYDEVQLVIERLIEDQAIVPEKRDHLISLLNDSKKLASVQVQINKQPPLDEELTNIGAMLNQSTNLEEQLIFIKKLSHQNIRPYLNDIAQFLAKDEGHPFLKTMLVHILKEQEIQQELSITKFGMSKKIVPYQLPSLQENSLFTSTVDLLKDTLESDNPIFYENVTSLVDRHFFLLFPLEFPDARPNVWAAAFHMLGLQYYGVDYIKEEIASLYHAPIKEIEQSFEFIQKLDENSYPIISSS